MIIRGNVVAAAALLIMMLMMLNAEDEAISRCQLPLCFCSGIQ
jgi:hypothetical protein